MEQFCKNKGCSLVGIEVKTDKHVCISCGKALTGTLKGLLGDLFNKANL